MEGALFDEEIEGAQGSPAALGGLPRFAECEFEATYPFGRVLLDDPQCPVRAVVEVFNPLVPGDEESSGLPIAVVTVSLVSSADEPLDCSLMLSVEALVGHSLRRQALASRPSAHIQAVGPLQGYLFSDEALVPSSEDWGTLAAAVMGEGTWVGPVWGLGKWNQGLLEMWRGFLETGEPRAGVFGVGRAGPSPTYGSSVAGTLGSRRALAPRGSTEVVLFLGWALPQPPLLDMGQSRARRDGRLLHRRELLC